MTWWDPAFNFTLGRECCNPRPLFYTYVHQQTAPGTAGFISYSDGCHDDVNKIIWNLLAWTRRRTRARRWSSTRGSSSGRMWRKPRRMALWRSRRTGRGRSQRTPGVDSTLAVWQQLEKLKPELKDNWRWQLCLLRANYDAYIRHRQRYEARLEDKANQIMAQAEKRGADAAMDAALAVLKRAETEPCRPDLRTRVDQLCQALFDSIRLQTSVKRFQASESERGCVLDFVDYPLNNRWWLEDQFTQIRKLPTEAGEGCAAGRAGPLGASRPGQLLRCAERPGEVTPPGPRPGAKYGSSDPAARDRFPRLRLGPGRLQPPAIDLARRAKAGADGL